MGSGGRKGEGLVWGTPIFLFKKDLFWCLNVPVLLGEMFDRCIDWDAFEKSLGK